MEKISRQTPARYSLSPGERVRVRASQKLCSLFHFHFGQVKARPHPGPLPQGEGELSSVTWRSGPVHGEKACGTAVAPAGKNKKAKTRTLFPLPEGEGQGREGAKPQF